MLQDQDPRTKADVKTDHLILHDRNRIDLLVSGINMCIIVALLILPVYTLWFFTTPLKPGRTYSTKLIIGVLAVFTMVFSGVLLLFTSAKRSEILASAAAYVFPVIQ